MANLSSLNNRIVINSNVISNPTAPNSVTLNSRRATDDLNRISSYINNILVPAFNTLSSGERYPFDVSQHGLGGSTIPTHLESCGNNNKLSELYWKISSEPGGGRPTTIKESFDYLNTRINYTLNLIQKPEISFPPEIGNLPEQVNNLFGYIKKMFFDLYSSPNQTHDLIPDINPTVPAYSTTSLIYQLYNQLFDVDLNGQGTPGNFYDLVDQSEKTGLTISLKNNLFVTELENLTDVDVADKTDTQVLSWDANSSKWVPVDKDSGPGYTGTTYNASTGQVTFNSDYPELQLTTGDLRGPAGADGAQGPQGEPGPAGADGEPGADALWNFRGAWDIETTYEIGDVVQHNGSSYYKYAFNEDPNADDYPTNPITWQLVAIKGENGAAGSQGPQGEPGPQGPEGPTGSIKLLSDVRDFMTPNDGDALIWDNTNSEWYATKVALGISTSGDYVESLLAGTGISLTPNPTSPTISLSESGVTANTYKSVTVDTYGRVTSGTNPTTLAGYGITDAQPLDATLTALSNVTTSANKLIYADGVDSFTTTDLSAFGRSLIDDADPFSARTTLGLVIGNHVQAYDPDLSAIAGLADNSTGYLKKTGLYSWTLDTPTVDTSNFVDKTTAQTITGTKTFTSTITGSISGNASTASDINGLATTGIVRRTGANTFTTTTNLSHLSDVSDVLNGNNRNVLQHNGTEWVSRNVTYTMNRISDYFPYAIGGYFEGPLFEANIDTSPGNTQQSIFAWYNYTNEVVYLNGYSVIVGHSANNTETHVFGLFTIDSANFQTNVYTIYDGTGGSVDSIGTTANSARRIAILNKNFTTGSGIITVDPDTYVGVYCQRIIDKSPSEYRISVNLHSFVKIIKP